MNIENLKDKILSFKPDFANDAFKSSDSKYFILTATKITLIPFLSFCIVGFSLWTIMELNFNFFVANGFESGQGFKEDFYNIIFSGISDYIIYTGIVLCLTFMIGLVISWLALRAFDQIKDFSEAMIEDYDQELEVQGLNKNKLVYQVSRIFFKYMQLVVKNGKRPKIKLPANIENLDTPRLDKVFLTQYLLIIGIICIITNFLLYTFTTELYHSIITNGTSVIDMNLIVTSFIGAQQSLLSNVHTVAITFNILGYMVISRSIIKSVDGVSYGFSRDMVQIIQGNHNIRLRPRFADPGLSMANGINDFLDDTFGHEESHQDFDESVDEVIQELSHSQFEDEIEDESNLYPIHSESIQEDLEDLPPAFIEERQVVGGEKVFHVTAPDGTKVEGLSEETLFRIINGSEKS